MQNKFVVVLAVASITAVMSTSAFGAMAGANTVNSAAIVDGAIATVDIANGAVTGAKIANGTITATQIASGTITAAQLGANSVTSTQIAAGAVTDSKITGTISVGKLPVGITSTTVAAGNHTHSGAIKYAQVVVVAKSGGDSSNPATAVNSITDASASKPYLVKVMPGVYDLVTTPLVMKPFVYLEGSGDASVITSQVVNPTSDCTFGTVNMANNSTVRNIRITNTANNTPVDGMAAAVAFQGVTSTLESVSAVSGTSTVLNYDSHATAICALNGANATLNNISADSIGNGLTWTHTIVNGNDSTMKINDATIVSSGPNFSRAIDCNCHGSNGICGTAVVTVTNSSLKTNLATDGEGFYAGDCKSVEIVNSKISSDNLNPVGGGDITIFKILYSQLISSNGFSPSSLGGFPTITYNVDGNGVPIPNFP
jgi:hypothetical protein